MKLRKLLSCIAIASICAYPGHSNAQFAYENMRQGIRYKVYIYDKQAIGDGKWEFQTKAVYSSCCLKSATFQNRPKSRQIFGLILSEHV